MCIERKCKTSVQISKASSSCDPERRHGERSKVLLERLNWLPLKDQINLLRCKLLFRLITKAGCASHITELLPRNSGAHGSIVRLVVMRIII